MSEQEPLSGTDALNLVFDSPGEPLTVFVEARLCEQVSEDRLRAAFLSLARTMPRMVSVVRRSWEGWHFIRRPFASQVPLVLSPYPAGTPVPEVRSRLASSHLDPSRQLARVVVAGDGRDYLMGLFHHAGFDGTTAVACVLGICWILQGEPPEGLPTRLAGLLEAPERLEGPPPGNARPPRPFAFPVKLGAPLHLRGKPAPGDSGQGVILASVEENELPRPLTAMVVACWARALAEHALRNGADSARHRYLAVDLPVRVSPVSLSCPHNSSILARLVLPCQPSKSVEELAALARSQIQAAKQGGRQEPHWIRALASRRRLAQILPVARSALAPVSVSTTIVSNLSRLPDECAPEVVDELFFAPGLQSRKGVGLGLLGARGRVHFCVRHYRKTLGDGDALALLQKFLSGLREAAGLP